MTLNPISSGKLYTLDFVEFINDVPTTPLDDGHAFWALWRSFLTSLTNGCDSFWDAMMKIYTDQTAFAGNQTERDRFKAIYLKNPPDVVISDMQSENLYGRHKQLPCLWRFIHVSKRYVDLWVAARDETTAMGYEALLKAILVHESAHWAQTLKVGLLPADLTVDQFELSSQCEKLRQKKKMTPQRFRTFVSSKAEAGYYVELAVFGGILSFYDDKLTIVTSSTSWQNDVSVDALRALRNLGLCRLVSQAAPQTPHFSSPTTIRNRQEAPAMLCDSDSDDEEQSEPLSFPIRCPRDYPELDL